MDVPGAGGVGGTATLPGANEGNFRGLDPDAFFNLLIAELKNQDPLNPLDNTQLLQQVATIREVGVSMQLNETLQAVMFGQQISSAAALLGKTIRGLSEAGEEVTGTVDRITIEEEKVVLHVGQEQVRLNNVAEILPDDPPQNGNTN